jgi:hypothetical protein
MRGLKPSLNPAGYMAALGAVYAAAAMLANAYNGHGVIDPQVVVAGAGAFLALLTRQAVTPVKDPRDGNGNALVTGQATPSMPQTRAQPPVWSGAVTPLPGNPRPVPPTDVPPPPPPKGGE